MRIGVANQFKLGNQCFETVELFLSARGRCSFSKWPVLQLVTRAQAQRLGEKTVMGNRRPGAHWFTTKSMSKSRGRGTYVAHLPLQATVPYLRSRRKRHGAVADLR